MSELKKNEISFLNVLFCLLVIFIHIASAPVSGLSRDSMKYVIFFVPWRLSAFVVQGFIFLSAMKMFLKLPQKTNYKKYYLSRIKKIILPYVLAVLVFYIYFVNREYFPFRVQDFFGYVLKGDLVSHFYFVIIIAQFYLLRPFWKFIVLRVKENGRLQIIITAVSLILSIWCAKYLPEFLKEKIGIEFAYNDRIFTTYLIYWVWGMFAGINYDYFKENIQKRKIIYFIYPVMAVIEAYFAYRSFTGAHIPYVEDIHFLYCISAIIFWFSMGTKISDKILDITLFKKINGASYYIYLIHPLFIFEIDEGMRSVGVVSTESTFAIRGIVTYFGAITLCIVYTEIKKKIINKR